jgi:3-oxoacyl-[acyl-carrier protein] reductase
MKLSFEGRAVVVTGGAGGFGAATVRTFAEAGANVVVSDIDGDRAAELAGGLPSAIAVRTDAGVPHRQGPLVDMEVDEVDAQLAVNVRSAVLGCKFAVPALRRAGGGVIVNTASMVGKQLRTGMAVYNATKGRSSRSPAG